MSKGFTADLSALPEEGLLVVGFSGGADSTALAHYLSEHVQQERILLAHVNHMLRGAEAERDEASVREFARSRGLRLAVSRVDVAALAKKEGKGIEACGREARYAFFLSLAAGENDRILTAHHADDLAETMLLNLCRGAGLEGLCGIPKTRGKVVRPLLGVSREEIEQYCKGHSLSFVEDSTNLSAEYARNLVRLEVMPLLRRLNPQATKAFLQTASLLSEDRDLLRRQTDALLREARRPYGLSAEALMGAPLPLRARAVKRFLEEAGCENLEKKHLDAALLCLAQGGAVQLPNGVTVRRGQGVLSAVQRTEQLPFCCPLSLGRTRLPNGKTVVLEKKPAAELKDGKKINNLYFKKALDCGTMIGNPAARLRREGDRFAPAGRGCTKPLKQVFQECGMPQDLRNGAVLLELDGQIVFCEGVGPAEGFQVTERTSEALLVTIEE